MWMGLTLGWSRITCVLSVYTGVLYTGFLCLHDKNECQMGSLKICGNYTTCYNTYGSYYCTCNEGYRPSNKMESFIPNDGTHCMIVNCGSPPSLLNTLYQPVSTTYGSTVVYQCQVGYVLITGNDTSVCSAQGQWEGANLECEAVDCGSPPTLPNTVSYPPHNTTYGSTVKYRCQDGYVPVRENDTLICSAQGQWEGAKLECKAVNCGLPPTLLNMMSSQPINTTYGSAVTYQCQIGYVPVRGNDTSVCSAQGQWEGVNLECEAVECGPPPVLQNTVQYLPSNTTFGSTVMYQCEVGYLHVKGNVTSVCSIQGQWEGPHLECKALDCGSPPVLLNALTHRPVNTTYGSTVMYQCWVGYVPVRGNVTSVCSARGQWEGANLECEALDCGSPPALPNARPHRPVNTSYGSTVMYQCRVGYLPVRGNVTSVCSARGQWEGANLECEAVDCGSPPSLLNTLYHQPVNTTYGSTVVYQCQVGYVPVRGNYTSVCSAQGQWVGANLECEAVDCGSPPSLLNTLSHRRVNTTYGSKVVYQCQIGYMQVTGNDTSVCSAQGQWKGANLKCEGLCSNTFLSLS
ncbi:sushi, von Willebrand factor type A, EGF and pentraxin domain-containing protein 1-like isoform X2 [Rhincodon typus]|uniref:sushi, von Willebrand factor type A, EGF and pentraxin domain-containing protein 1-like isoform X2 n=1 Tax=Rhincodon typus TaxID=259920 RepID=UPI002030BC4A|nr:sushi, von Willebrand factor type A, EGF and pentraxin domain-containing protein 1-like isoform X2 [Rhincodon typus]